MATNTSTAPPPPTPARKQAAANVLGRVFGADVVAALHEGFLKGDLTGVVPLLAAATAKPYLLQAAREAFVAVCEAEKADEDTKRARTLDAGRKEGETGRERKEGEEKRG